MSNFLSKSKNLIKANIALAPATALALAPAVTAFAASNGASKYLTHNGADMNTFADLIMKFVDPLQGIATVILICVAVILGLKIGASSVAGDPRARTSSIVGLFFVIIGEFVVINAQAVVSVVNSINTNGVVVMHTLTNFIH